MAKPLLRRYSVALTTAGTATTVVPAVPAARALVVSKIAIAQTGTATAKITLTVGGAAVVSGLTLNPGEVYTETGLVLLATETVTATCDAASTVTVSAFGEEVDN